MDFQQLWKMEESFWLSGPDFYESSMASNARMVFPEPVGILAGAEIVEGLQQAPRWESIEFERQSEVSLGETAVLAYKATGKRDGDAPYSALCASTYVCQSNTWVLLAHQQTLAT